MPKILKKNIPHASEGKRLDVAVAALFPQITRSQAQRLIREGNVRVAGETAKSSQKVRAGQELTLTLVEPEASVHEAQPIPLDIVFEDKHLVVVNKPPGLVVHPGAGVKSGTLVNALLAHCGDLSGIGGVLRPGIVHRLDKGTSGLLVAAKTDQAHLSLAKQIAQREVARKYHLVVWGLLKESSGRIEAPIARHRIHRKKMAVDWQRGKKAATRFSVLERFCFATHATASLETGRTHQIRVHFSYLGHPVFGDPLYGGRTKAVSRLGGERRREASDMLGLIERPALHAAALTFRHPISGETLSFEIPLPADIQGLLEALRRGQQAIA
ncbi:MAG: RluA family pseudouridine synthase [Candidatus Eisenbacteria bacterium]|nr:RluA family pseudouridine synthase [Candidatus Eisenbacteria bacterium]